MQAAVKYLWNCVHRLFAKKEFCCIVCAVVVMFERGASAQVASWGGYSFIINLLPIHCLASIFTGRLTAKLYIAYAPLIVLGTLEAGEQEGHTSPFLCKLSPLSGGWHGIVASMPGCA